MESIIQLLPDAIANQIAAGEVVQRPASVVKELLENALDAGADRIDLFIKDAGKTLIQVTDDGRGMNAPDARLCFERHATSKIRSQDDLFKIQTLGFRGEALASIAAVAQVRLRTRQAEDGLGTELDIEASEVKRQEPAVAPAGSTFMVRNLFFNVPARRNFLKSNSVETRHILNEFIRAAIPHPDVHFTFRHNTTQVYDLLPGALDQRLVQLFGDELGDRLVWIEEESGYVKISGYVGKRDLHRKHRSEQFFFVNNRFIKSGYLHHAIAEAYKEVIPKDSYPFYCVFLEMDPVHVDINIHPTKTEVKFDDERTLYALLRSLVKRGLGGIEQAPVADFTDDSLKREIYRRPEAAAPDDSLTIAEFRSRNGGGSRPTPSRPAASDRPKPQAWDQLYKPPSPLRPSSESEAEAAPLFSRAEAGRTIEIEVMGRFGLRYVVAQRGGKLILADAKRAQQRIFYERFLNARDGEKTASQQLLFPQNFECSPADFLVLQDAEASLQKMGFDLKPFGKNAAIVHGAPAGLPPKRIQSVLEEAIAEMRTHGTVSNDAQGYDRIARAVALRAAAATDSPQDVAGLRDLLYLLFRCEVPAFSPTGKPVFRAWSPEEVKGLL